MINVDPKSFDKLFFDMQRVDIELAQALEMFTKLAAEIDAYDTETGILRTDAKFDMSPLELSARCSIESYLHTATAALNAARLVARGAACGCAQKNPHLAETHVA